MVMLIQTNFGYVTEGIEVMDAICADTQPTDNNASITAKKTTHYSKYQD